MSPVQALRILITFESFLCLGWMLGFTLVYFRLSRAGENASWVPTAMGPVTTGMVLIVIGTIWRSIEFYRAPFSWATVFTAVGVGILDLGAYRLRSGLRARERERTNGEHDGPTASR